MYKIFTTKEPAAQDFTLDSERPHGDDLTALRTEDESTLRLENNDYLSSLKAQKKYVQQQPMRKISNDLALLSGRTNLIQRSFMQTFILANNSSSTSCSSEISPRTNINRVLVQDAPDETCLNLVT